MSLIAKELPEQIILSKQDLVQLEYLLSSGQLGSCLPILGFLQTIVAKQITDRKLMTYD